MGKGYKGKNPRGAKRETNEEAEAEFLAQQRARGGAYASTWCIASATAI